MMHAIIIRFSGAVAMNLSFNVFQSTLFVISIHTTFPSFFLRIFGTRVYILLVIIFQIIIP